LGWLGSSGASPQMSLLGAACGRPPATHASARKTCHTQDERMSPGEPVRKDPTGFHPPYSGKVVGT